MQALKEKIIEIARAFDKDDMGIGTSGNVSARFDDRIFITPSGVAPERLDVDNIVTLNLAGDVEKAIYKPSSEWHFHCDIYQSHQAVNAIVHTHSPYAVAQSCLNKPIPAFHYMVAKVGGSYVPCADYATFGTEALSQNIVATLRDFKGCLLANHGQLATGATLDQAYAMAREIETLARQYILACSVGEPVLLSEQEMQVNIEKFKTYGTAQKQD